MGVSALILTKIALAHLCSLASAAFDLQESDSFVQTCLYDVLRKTDHLARTLKASVEIPAEYTGMHNTIGAVGHMLYSAQRGKLLDREEHNVLPHSELLLASAEQLLAMIGTDHHAYSTVQDACHQLKTAREKYQEAQAINDAKRKTIDAETKYLNGRLCHGRLIEADPLTRMREATSSSCLTIPYCSQGNQSRDDLIDSLGNGFSLMQLFYDSTDESVRILCPFVHLAVLTFRLIVLGHQIYG